jgi:hypothetical protein
MPTIRNAPSRMSMRNGGSVLPWYPEIRNNTGLAPINIPAAAARAGDVGRRRISKLNRRSSRPRSWRSPGW